MIPFFLFSPLLAFFFYLVTSFPFLLQVFCGLIHIIYLTLESYYACELSAESVFYIRLSESVPFPNGIALKASIRIYMILYFIIFLFADFFINLEKFILDSVLELKFLDVISRFSCLTVRYFVHKNVR